MTAEDNTHEIPEPVGKFILDNLALEKRVQAENGLYIHYTDVCTLLKIYANHQVEASKEVVKKCDCFDKKECLQFGCQNPSKVEEGKHGMYTEDGWIPFEKQKPELYQEILIVWPSGSIEPEYRRWDEKMAKHDWSLMRWFQYLIISQTAPTHSQREVI